MKKKFVGVFAACLLLAFSALALAGCGAGKSEKLVVGFDAAYAPYGYLVTDGGEGYEASDGNKYTGFDLDLANAVCEENGWELEVTPIDWDAKNALLGSGDITCVWNGFTIEGREDDYAFTEPYMDNAQVIVVKAGSDIKSFADLKGKTVITQTESSAQNALETDRKDLADTFKSLQTIADYNNAFMQLDSGAVDAVACDLSVAAFHLAAEPDKYVQLDEILFNEHYGVGFAKTDEGKKMADKVTETLKKLDEKGTVKELCEKYADQKMDYEKWCLGK